MANTPDEDAREAWFEQLSEELYPEHRARAIDEFSADRLCSYYEYDEMLMRPAIDAFHEAKRLHGGESATDKDARHAQDVASAVFTSIVTPLIAALGLTIGERGRIVKPGKLDGQ